MLYFIRHAKDDESYVGSWSSVEILNEEIPRIKEQAKFIKKLGIKTIITSDVKRALQTAEIISKETGIEIIEDSNLREQNKGTLTGRLKSTLTEEEKKLLDNQQINTNFPEGETLIDLYNRIKIYIQTINNYPDDTLIVTHRGVINMIYYILNDISLDMDKDKFKVKHLSIHEYDKNKEYIRRIK